jgi:hypothetical protein
MRLAVYNKKNILLSIIVLALLLFIKESRVMDQIAIVDNHTANDLSDKNTVNGRAPQSSQEKDFLNMTLEELMQIPVTSVSFWNNNGNYLDMSIEELMKIPVS